MNNQTELFSKDHNKLLNIAGWASNLAWLTLVLYIISAALVIVEDQANYRRMAAVSSSYQSDSDYWETAKTDPLYYLVDIGSDMIKRLLGGFVYYVILKGISLGLSMIVETDMNYREREDLGGEL